jgi:hypothetical protein
MSVIYKKSRPSLTKAQANIDFLQKQAGNLLAANSQLSPGDVIAGLIKHVLENNAIYETKSIKLAAISSLVDAYSQQKDLREV